MPYGETLTYGELAGLIGSPDATRAVAQACGRNPVLLAVPCHRVVAADGLGGFTAGVRVKRRLLTLERGSGHDLPLFEVATLREETAHRRESDRAVRDALPDELDAWLAHRLEGRPLHMLTICSKKALIN